jgi:hypothetical protein
MLDRKLTITIFGILILLLFLSAELRYRNAIVLLLIVITAVVLFGKWDKDRVGEREPARAPKPARRKAPELKPADQKALQEIQNLDLAEARKRAEKALTNVNVWRLIPAEGSENEMLLRLSPGLRELLARYAAVEAVAGPANLGSDGVRRFDWPTDQFLGFGQNSQGEKPVLLQIGNDMDGNPIVVRSQEETVRVVHGSRSAPEKAWWATYPSVYHWLLTAEVFFRA